MREWVSEQVRRVVTSCIMGLYILLVCDDGCVNIGCVRDWARILSMWVGKAWCS